MNRHGFYINDVWFDPVCMEPRMVYSKQDEVIEKCFDEFKSSIIFEKETGVRMFGFDEKLDLNERIRIAIVHLIDEIMNKCYGRLHSRIKAFLRIEDDNLIFRCADSGCNDPDDINSYLDEFRQYIKPIILPVTVKQEYVSVIEIKDLSGEWITYKNPEKVEYVNNHSNILIEDKGIEHVIRFAEVKRFTQSIHRIELNTKNNHK